MFLLINKQIGLTSHDIIDLLRKITGIKKIGHSGTLDPFASGLLIVGVGRESTKQLGNYLKLDKTYRATIRLGSTSNTYDKTGKITHYAPIGSELTSSHGQTQWMPLQKKTIEDTLLRFEGPQLQTPPMYSAKKVKGQKLYQLARKGETIERKPNWIMIHYIKLLSVSDSQLSIEVQCASGTYIRSLAHDIGQALETGAYLENLTRTQIGLFSLDEAIAVNDLTTENWKNFIHNKLPVTRYSLPVILTFGTFDHLHPGHLNFFQQAKKTAKSYLIVGIGRDSVVEKIKNSTPDHDELTRLRNVRAVPEVDHAYLLPENPDQRFDWIHSVKPDIIALGYDQTSFTEDLKTELAKRNCRPNIIRLAPYHPEKYKSSLVKKCKTDRVT